MDILDTIVESRLKDYAEPAVPMKELIARYNDRSDFRPFQQTLYRKARKSSTNQKAATAAIIAEIKRGSPSKGMFAPDLNPAERAALYEQGGAACLSVLTEPQFFFGTLGDLIAARQKTALPVLRKDFIVSEYQVRETALYADCMLLIARCMPARQLSDLHQLAQELRLEVLVEVFDENDIEKVAPYHFSMIGINNRNLGTMSVDVNHSLDLMPYFSPDQTLVMASGIRNRQDIDTAMRHSITSFLIGETLSVSENPVETLKELVGGSEL